MARRTDEGGFGLRHQRRPGAAVAGHEQPALVQRDVDLRWIAEPYALVTTNVPGQHACGNVDRCLRGVGQLVACPVLRTVFGGFVAHQLQQLIVGGVAHFDHGMQRPVERTRIDIGDIDDQATELGTTVAFDHAQLLTVDQAFGMQPGLRVVAVAVDDQRSAIPPADGIAHPDRQWIGLELASVEEDLPIGQVAVEDGKRACALHDALVTTSATAGTGDIARAAGQALHVRTLLVVVLLVGCHGIADPWLEPAGITQVAADARGTPETRQLRPAIRRARRGSLQVGLAIWQAWNAWRRQIEPLRICRRG